MGSSTEQLLKRATPVAKAATSAPANRPKAIDHYASFVVQGALSKTTEILLVDDVVTRGATLLGAANRIAEAFPEATVRGFAAMRAIGSTDKFVSVYNPVMGIISLNPNGCFRTP